MTSDQFGGILRAVLGAAIGYAAGKGLIGADAVGGLVAALTTVGIAVWSAVTNKPSKLA